MANIVNDRINAAQAELAKRAQELKRIVAKSKTKKLDPEFNEGVNLVSQMIEEHSKLLDSGVLDTPATAQEQERNLMLMTGTMNQSAQEGIKYATDAIDSMLRTLDEMTR